MPKVNIKNKKAKYEYEFVEEYTAGIQLNGTEIKSIRNNNASIAEAYCVVENDEVFIRNMYIKEYENAGFTSHQVRRDRKLLLNQSEIKKIARKLKVKGLSLIPYILFINDNGWAKIIIKLAKGKKLYDKRNSIKDSDIKRDVDRRLKEY